VSSETPQKVRILILDDHSLFREGLARLLEVEQDFAVVAHCSSVDEALRALAGAAIDIVLLDFDLGLQRGTEFLVDSRKKGFQGKILVVTAGLSDDDATQLLREGAAGIFLKHNPPALLVKSIRKVMEGQSWIEARYLSALLQGGASRKAESAPFTGRERAVLRGVFEGLMNKEISDRLKISETSVKAALQQLFEKTGVRTRGQLVRVALERYSDELE
jgi:DNA-binding NarL/FixJ family response regulator